MGVAERLDLRTRRGWIWLIVGGFSVLVLGIIVGLQQTGPLCGSPLLPQSRPAEIYRLAPARVQGGGGVLSEYRSASVPTWGLIALGVVLVLAAVVIRVVSINRNSDVL